MANEAVIGRSQHNDGLAEGPPRFMAFFRTSVGTLLAGSCTRGLTRSTDDGATWQPVAGWGHVSHNFFTHDSEGALLVATSAGLARSIDDGVTWSALDTRPAFAALADGLRGPPNETVYRLVRLVDGRVLAATDGNGVWVHDSTGWRPTGLDGAIVYSLAVTAAGTWLAGTRGRHIWRSEDEGHSWQPSLDGLQDSYVHCLAFDQSGAALAGTGNGIARSADDGASWVDVGEPLAGNRIFAILAWGDGQLLAGGYAQVWRFAAGAWAGVDPGLTPDESWAVSWDGDRLLAGAKMGVLQSDDRGMTWRPTGEPSVVFGFTHASEGGLLAGGDRGVFRASDWSRIGDIGRRVFCLVALAEDGLLVGTVAGGLHRFDGEWMRVESGFDHPNVYSLTRLRTGRLLASTGAVLNGAKSGGIFASDDEGRSWRLVWVGQSVYEIVEMSNGTVFAGAQRCRILCSSDGGDQWTPCPQATQHEAKIYSLTGDDNDWLYLGTGGELLRSRDSAATWELVGDGLDGVSVYAMSAQVRGVLVAATSSGMYTSDDCGETWRTGSLRRSIDADEPD